MKVLFMTSEAYPLAKTGGLGDVSGSLPPALQQAGLDPIILMPAYPFVLKHADCRKTIASTKYYNQEVNLIETSLPGTNVTVWLVDCPAAFYRPGGPYNDHHGHFWHDNAFRFTMFNHTAVDVALGHLELDWVPDIVHCNDWQSGLVPALLSLHKQRPATVFTIHNLAYQGIFDQQNFFDLHLPKKLWDIHGVEFYGSFSFIKGGLCFADKITTVSPNYAREILRPEFGYGLSSLLQYREDDLSGILNGIDYRIWNPQTDSFVEHHFDREHLDAKVENKSALQQYCGFEINNDYLLLGMVSRLVEQKGFDIILNCLDDMMQLPIQLVILGNGDCHYEIQLSEIAQNYPRQLKIVVGYDEQLAHRIEAGCDAYLMPSTFEPCGLNQMYSLAYGTLPVVTPVGGLLDTVKDSTQENIAQHTANGFVMSEVSAAALMHGLRRASNVFHQQPQLWRQLQYNAMSEDFSWNKRAQEYINLYQQAITV